MGLSKQLQKEILQEVINILDDSGMCIAFTKVHPRISFRNISYYIDNYSRKEYLKFYWYIPTIWIFAFFSPFWDIPKNLDRRKKFLQHLIDKL